MGAYENLRRVVLLGAHEVSAHIADATVDRQQMLAAWASGVLKRSEGSRLISTERKSVGYAKEWGPTRADDVSCVFLGAQIPFIPAPVDHGWYKLVTKCYIHEVMKRKLSEILDPCDYSGVELKWRQGVNWIRYHHLTVYFPSPPPDTSCTTTKSASAHQYL